jgi:hypothetical protein
MNWKGFGGKNLSSKQSTMPGGNVERYEMLDRVICGMNEGCMDGNRA